ncbi:MAG: hypothetical protein GY830_07075 [Bacteroidetes bacterium]|nr:hypothetical protein [Bacteroidota bacterium]
MLYYNIDTIYIKMILRNFEISGKSLNNKYILFFLILIQFTYCKSPNSQPNEQVFAEPIINKTTKKSKIKQPQKQQSIQLSEKTKFVNDHKDKYNSDNLETDKQLESYDSKISGKSTKPKTNDCQKCKCKKKCKYTCKKLKNCRNKKYTVELIEKELYFKNLPKKFDGFKIGLLADVHIGYFNKWHFDKIYNTFFKNTKKGNFPVDIMIFLGDLVNYNLCEIDKRGKKWLQSFKNIAKYNLMLAILGNHDYDSYKFMVPKVPEKNYEKKMQNFQNKVLGWKLLKNSHLILQKGDSKLKFLGIEHLGKCTIVTNRGDVKKSIRNLDSAYEIDDDELIKISKQKVNKKNKSFSIMLAHDPSIVKDLWYKYKMPLVFSGHTHGSPIMLDGIKDGSFKSLVCRNKYPAGLYKSRCRNKYLYVSKGVGLSGVNLFGKQIVLRDRERKDRTPEVTIITLCKCK